MIHVLFVSPCWIPSILLYFALDVQFLHFAYPPRQASLSGLFQTRSSHWNWHRFHSHQALYDLGQARWWWVDLMKGRMRHSVDGGRYEQISSRNESVEVLWIRSMLTSWVEFKFYLSYLKGCCLGTSSPLSAKVVEGYRSRCLGKEWNWFAFKCFQPCLGINM